MPGWTEAGPVSAPGRIVRESRGPTERRRERRCQGSSGSTGAPGDPRGLGVPPDIPARCGSHRGAGSGSSSCVGSISWFRWSRAFGQGGQARGCSCGAGPETCLRLGNGSSRRRDSQTPLPRGLHGTDPERPGQEGKRTDDQQREGRDRQVEDQSHGARRVADRPVNGRFAWMARRCRSGRRWRRSPR